jgi:hypothetical protein
MEQMKNTKEAIIALLILGKFVADRVKDGVQLEDALALGQALMTEGEFKTLVQAGYADMDKIGEEFADFNLVKGLELVQIIPKMVEILQAK